MPNQEPKPISDQIVDELFKSLENSDAFDKIVIDKLKELSSDGKLTSSKAIIDAISVPKEKS